MDKDCGCCQGTEKLTPGSTVNRPGLSELAYRIGTHATFLETMKARLSSSTFGPLQGLTTRAGSDPSIALLDGWAAVADVLTFYQERIVNEGYLRTATERLSILELARLVGYTLRPGVAATVYLAYTLDKDAEVTIAVGARAQSVPGPGELPQAFETAEKLEAQARWNNLQPRLTQPKYITLEMVADPARPLDLYFKGVTTLLKPGDPLLFIFGRTRGKQFLRRIATVEPQAAEDRTRVTFQTPVTFPAPQKTGLEKLKELTKTIAEILDRYGRLERFEVSPNSAMARRVKADLKEWGNALALLQGGITEAETDPTKLPKVSQKIEDFLQTTVLPAVREEHQLAIKGKFAQLEPWLDGLGDELEEVSDQLTANVASAAKAPELATSATLKFSAFGSLLKPLQTPASVPPPNAQRLDRKADEIFGANLAGAKPVKQDPDQDKSANLPDIGLQLAASMSSLLRGSLYTALGNAEVTTTAALESVDALEVKAAPFGYNAPLKPITDGRGVPIVSKEWQLPGTIAVEMVVTDNLAPRSVTISITMDGETRSETADDFDTNDEASITIEGSESRTFKINFDTTPGHISCTVSEGTAVIETIVVERGIVPAPGPGVLVVPPGQFGVKVRDDEQKTLAPGTELRYDNAEGSVTINTSGQQVKVTDVSPGPLSEAQRQVIALNAQYDQITPGSWVAIEFFDRKTSEARRSFFRVASTRTVTRVDFGVTGQVTELTLSERWLDRGLLAAHNNSLAALRGITVYAQNKPRELAEEPIDADVEGDTVELDSLYPALKSGRWLIVSGERTDIVGSSGVKASELVMLAGNIQGVQQVEKNQLGFDDERLETHPKELIDLPGDKTHTFIKLAKKLAYSYKRDTVVIHGNVARATHGETRNEVLGSGDGSRALQTFELHQSPLTFVAAPTPAGAQSSLEVRVNDVLWHETDSLAGLKPIDRLYITRTDDADKTTVIFGNGEHGARLPTGIENVKAVYRTGIGEPGNVRAEQISLLATKPLGVKEVINPLRASGGAGRETRDQGRRNAPLAVTGLDRLVSVQDYEDFTRTFAGIGKASATRLSDGRRELVHLTIAGAGDIPIDTSSDLYRNLGLALQRLGDPFQPIKIELRELALLVISAGVRVHPDYLWEAVEPRVRAALLDAFSFERRELGQDVFLSEVISAAQQISGVVYIDVDVLDSIPEEIITVPGKLEEKLKQLANAPLLSQQINSELPSHLGVRAAQLVMLSPAIPDTLILKELKP